MRWIARHLLLTGILLGILLSGGVAAIGAICVIEFGLFDVAADSPPGKIITWAMHTTMIRAVKTSARREKRLGGFSAGQVRHGFDEYEEKCVGCHGGPGVARADWVRGLNPTPPFLIGAARRWSPTELKFIVAHGIKMTAMPAWALSRSDRDLTDIVAFLEALPDITAGEYAGMRASNRQKEAGYKRTRGSAVPR